MPVILSAVRTPIGNFMGGLAPLSVPELTAKASTEDFRHARGDATHKPANWTSPLFPHPFTVVERFPLDLLLLL